MREHVRAALIEGWPLFLTYAIIGVPYGVLARQAGLSVPEASASSFLIFAGSAQFAVVELLHVGASVPIVVLTVLLVNARYLVIASALRPFVAGAPLVRRLEIAYLLTDKSFAMGIGWFRRGHRELAYYVTFGVGLWVAWNASTLAGALLGAGVTEPRRFGVDFVITAAFLAIVTIGLRHRADVVVAVLAAVLAASLRLGGSSALGPGSLERGAVVAVAARRALTDGHATASAKMAEWASSGELPSSRPRPFAS